MRHSDIRTTLNIYGDVVTNEMAQAHCKGGAAGLTSQSDCKLIAGSVKSFKTGGESGIRTHVRVSPKHAFQACAFSHSAISPALSGSLRSGGPFKPDFGLSGCAAS